MMMRRIILSSRRPSRLSILSTFSSKKDPFDVGHHPVHPISTGDIGADDEFSKQVVKAEEKRLLDRMTEIETGYFLCNLFLLLFSLVCLF